MWTEDGRLATQGASTYKLPTLGELPTEFHVALMPKATESTVIHGSKAVGEPPLMLAMSAREALRNAAAAFAEDPAHHDAQIGCPATPEAVFWSLDAARASGRAAVAAE